MNDDDNDDNHETTVMDDAEMRMIGNTTISDDDNDDDDENDGYYNNNYGNDDDYYDEDNMNDMNIDMPCAIQKYLVRNEITPKRISHIQFGILSAHEIQRLAEFQICSRELFTMPSRQPAIGGCLDPRLGVSDKVSTCATCYRKLVDCAGHFGYIKLALPVFHIGYMKHILNFLQCICKSCSRVLLIESEREKVLKYMRSNNNSNSSSTTKGTNNSNTNTIDTLGKMVQYKRVVDKCKKCKICPYCSAINGTVKKITGTPTLKIVHERYRTNSSSTTTGRTTKSTSTRPTSAAALAEEEFDRLLDKLDTAMEMNRDIEHILLPSSSSTQPNIVEDLLPTRVLELFQHISNVDCEILWMDPYLSGQRPENLILQNLLVPPVPIRPSVAMDIGGGSNEDDLTVKLQEIMDVNVALELALCKSGVQTRTIIEEWDFLQAQVAQYINGEMPGMQRPNGGGGGSHYKPMRGLCQRLKGKQGRFRGNLSGKRVDFSARTVISPDPNLLVDQVGVPVKVATIMTYPEPVSRITINKLRQRVRNGPFVHPGANMIRMRDGAFVKSLAFGDRELAAKNLRIGDIVERHMEDGDIVLFNRQPSLHKVSIMAHRVKVLDWKTFRFNICVCAPYNADFDGDEMNMHLPQTEEARTEASLLMGVVNNLVTPRNGEPIVAASQDFLSASYLLTQRDRFYTREQFCTLVSYYQDAEEHIDVPIPAILKPLPLWTGKQVFSMMLKPNKSCKVLVNFETREKNYSSKNKHFCANDGWVAFRNSELISGNIAKKTIGDGSKTGLLYVLLRDFRPNEAAQCMNRWSKFCGRFMGGHKGLSIGISDICPSNKLREIKNTILRDGYQKADLSIEQYNKGQLELRPGCDMLQSLEEILNGILGRLRESAGQEAMKALPWSNTPRIMADCGSKGSPLNISQMISCVGQQAVGGDRIQNGFVNRTLPHFEYHSLTPAAKGFVANSFYTGLTATEFFFHAMGGREGLVDTAVKTAETGYMARRLMKALEDLSLQYDSTVRNSENTVVQFTYGDDGLHPDKMEDSDRPVDFHRLRLHVSQISPCPDEATLSGKELISRVQTELTKTRFTSLLPVGRVFLEEIRDYFSELAKEQLNMIAETGNEENIGFRTWNSCRITPTQLELMLSTLRERVLHAFVEPGEAVGAIGAQSISEPGTQMTLKTFHFSGISSMNVTLGVPRLKEIINAAKKISTPIITAKLERDDSKVAARIVKAVIEKTTLGEVTKRMKEVYSSEMCYISIELDLKFIEKLKLNVDSVSVRNAILHGSPGVTRSAIIRALKDSDVQLKKGSNSRLRVMVPQIKTGKEDTPTYYAMQMLKSALPEVIVQGIASVGRAVINEQEKDGKPSYNLLMEGYGLLEVMGCPGIDGLHTTTNHVLEVEDVLGVEAARTQISSEIENIMSAYGIGIDPRHLLLLSDVMTFKGEVLGITRFGVSKMRESVLMLASFEKTTDHLFDAAVHGRTDAIVGVSECIIMGKDVPVGTGLPSLFWKLDI